MIMRYMERYAKVEITTDEFARICENNGIDLEMGILALRESKYFEVDELNGVIRVRER